MAESDRLLSDCTPIKGVPRVRIPLSPPFQKLKVLSGPVDTYALPATKAGFFFLLMILLFLPILKVTERYPTDWRNFYEGCFQRNYRCRSY